MLTPSALTGAYQFQYWNSKRARPDSRNLRGTEAMDSGWTNHVLGFGNPSFVGLHEAAKHRM
jgi:hypothetical protein